MSLSAHPTSAPRAFRSGPSPAALSISTSDARADQHSRTVFLDSRRILISRRLQGIDMRIGVPTRQYCGVALSLSSGPRPLWCVTLLHRDPDLSIPLMSSSDDTDIVAEWRSWSRYFGLPAIVEVEPGRFQTTRDSLPLCAGLRPHGRRRGRWLARRRPRFLVRRKLGRAGLLDRRFANEREIIARN